MLGLGPGDWLDDAKGRGKKGWPTLTGDDGAVMVVGGWVGACIYYDKKFVRQLSIRGRAERTIHVYVAYIRD